jgi:DNA-binding response OmpR family regulator
MRDALVALFALHPDIDTVLVETGTRGLEIAKPGRVDLVMMDVGLPEID